MEVGPPVNIKTTLLLGIPLIGIMAYVSWPRADINAPYHLKAETLSPERQQEIAGILKTVNTWCAEKRYDRLEKAFALNPADRLQAKEALGEDPVESSLQILKHASAELDWGNYAAVTYRNAPGLFDVTLKKKNNGEVISLRFTRQEKSGGYRLMSVIPGSPRV